MAPKDKKIIEDSEREGFPIFVLSARDMISISIIQHYRSLCKAEECGIDHINEISLRIDEFREWQHTHKEQVKLPD